jgi:hypothetical protein
MCEEHRRNRHRKYWWQAGPSLSKIAVYIVRNCNIAVVGDLHKVFLVEYGQYPSGNYTTWPRWIIVWVVGCFVFYILNYYLYVCLVVLVHAQVVTHMSPIPTILFDQEWESLFPLMRLPKAAAGYKRSKVDQVCSTSSPKNTIPPQAVHAFSIYHVLCLGWYSTGYIFSSKYNILAPLRYVHIWQPPLATASMEIYGDSCSDCLGATWYRYCPVFSETI